MLEDREIMDALLGKDSADREQGAEEWKFERLLDQIEEGLSEPEEVPQAAKSETKLGEESFEEELIPFLEMNIEAEEEVEREPAQEEEVVPHLQEVKEVPKEEIKVEVRPKPYFGRRVIASILLPLLAIGAGVSFLVVRTIDSKDHLNKGISYIEEGRFDEAEEEFKEGIRKKPFGKLKEYFRYGLAYLGKNEYKRAEAKFKYLLQERPRDLKTNHHLIKLYLAMEDNHRAKEVAVHILKRIAPKDVQAFLTLAKVSMEEQNLTEAYRFLDAALKIEPKNIEVLSTLQRVFIAGGEYDKALKVYRYIVAKVSKDKKDIDPEIMTRLGIAFCDRPQLAKELFLTALLCDPQNCEARYRLASLYLQEGYVEKARAELEKVLRDNPKFIPAKGLMGEIFLRQGKFDEAERLLMEAVATQSQNPENHYRMGNFYYATKRLSEAIKAYERADRLGFRTREMIYNWAVALYEEGDYQRAIDHLNELLKENPDNPILNYNLGNAYVRIHNWPKARDRYEEAITLYHKKLKAVKLSGRSRELEEATYLELAKVYNNIGVVYEKLNMEEESIRSYTKALECASWARQGDRIAYKNLNRFFESRPIKEISEAIHTQLKYSLEG